ncbi:MAG: zinc-ribbon domain-containing protein [Firmicutes bacterium]|nr:zinc-ribbon domain-containing protein [Bacillota bacterium]
MFCRHCGAEINDKAVVCVYCHKPVRADKTAGSGYHGVIGFVLAVLALFLPVTGLDIVCGTAAFIFSVVGLARNQRTGLSIAGIIISILAVIGAIVMLFDGTYHNYYII